MKRTAPKTRKHKPVLLETRFPTMAEIVRTYAASKKEVKDARRLVRKITRKNKQKKK